MPERSMKATLQYKGYLGSAEVDVEGGVLHGKLLYIRDTVTYSSATVEDLRVQFEKAVDDYLRLCAELGDQPNQPLKGSFNVRVGPERHRRIALAIQKKALGLNEFVCSAIDRELEAVERPWVGNLIAGTVLSSGNTYWMASANAHLHVWSPDTPKHSEGPAESVEHTAAAFTTNSTMQ
jgi:predicted HicB family RNase H-like nuclease